MLILELLYLTCALLLAIYAGGTVVLLLAYWRHRFDPAELPVVDDWPSVAVQLPVYNEREVV